MLETFLKEAAYASPDPESTFNALSDFCAANPDYIEDVKRDIKPITALFSHSRFLSNFARSNPDMLFRSIAEIRQPVKKELIASDLSREFAGAGHSREQCMSLIRRFKKKTLVRITLRDILGIADIAETMQELSALADVITEQATEIVDAEMKKIYGEPKDHAFSVISVGKLGGNELNFSSDIDLIYAYKTEDGETSGIATSGGITANRIGNHEYYCKLGENLNKLLSTTTEDGLAYRVDLRLRPEGRRGSIAMSLPAYEIYYESWGRAWERAVFLRARPIAGDAELGRAFMDMIAPFVYRKYLDFSAIDEIRRMKTRIDETFKKDDIKRGYGGIREIEFFVHAIQLIYGGKEPLLREPNLLIALHRLFQKNLIGHQDFSVLSENYRYMRKLEHRLQQVNDLQTHTLPADEKELAALAKKMGFSSKHEFMSDLEKRRKQVRQIYDSLFGTKDGRQSVDSEEAAAWTEIFFSEEITDAEMKELLSKHSIKDRERAARNIRHIKDSTLSFQTLRGRRLLSSMLPVLLSEAIRSQHPDVAINNLQSFASLLASEASYLELFAANKKLIPALANIFSQSEYLSKIIIKRREYLELLGHEIFSKKTLRQLKKEIQQAMAQDRSIADAIRMVRQIEEIRLGLLFLEKKMPAPRLIKGISKAAEAVVSICVEDMQGSGLSVIGMGKAGGRELTFSSDLDLIFTCRDSMTVSATKAAERLIRLLTSHTKDGIAYSVDTRLRPDGTKGPLVATISAYFDYYEKSAQFWEFQALLKARPLSGDKDSACAFMEMRTDILMRKGRDVSASDIRAMRGRIQKELSKEAEGLDIKLGPGGLEEIEFIVQYLQLKNCFKHREILVQASLDAIRRLAEFDVINKKEAHEMEDAYIFYRTIESLMRLKSEAVLKRDSAAVDDIAAFAGFGDSEGFMKSITDKRAIVRDMFERYLR